MAGRPRIPDEPKRERVSADVRVPLRDALDRLARANRRTRAQELTLALEHHVEKARQPEPPAA